MKSLPNKARHFILRHRRIVRTMFLSCASGIAILSLLPGSGAPPLWHWDKVGHFGTYAVLGFLGCAAFESRPSRILSALFGIILGAMLEWGQSFVPARDPSLPDVVANTLGVVVGLLLWYRPGIRKSDA